jgi:hypothetical protein
MPSDKCEKCERLLKACEAVLPFARTQSCVYMDGSDCPDPGHDHMTRCCDWGPLVEQLTEAIRQAGGSLEAWTEEVRGTYQLESQIASLTAANSRLEAELAQAREREAGLREALWDAARDIDEWLQLAERQATELPNADYHPLAPTTIGIKASRVVREKVRLALVATRPEDTNATQP